MVVVPTMASCGVWVIVLIVTADCVRVTCKKRNYGKGQSWWRGIAGNWMPPSIAANGFLHLCLLSADCLRIDLGDFLHVCFFQGKPYKQQRMWKVCIVKIAWRIHLNKVFKLQTIQELKHESESGAPPRPSYCHPDEKILETPLDRISLPNKNKHCKFKVLNMCVSTLHTPSFLWFYCWLTEDFVLVSN